MVNLLGGNIMNVNEFISKYTNYSKDELKENFSSIYTNFCCDYASMKTDIFVKYNSKIINSEELFSEEEKRKLYLEREKELNNLANARTDISKVISETMGLIKL